MKTRVFWIAGVRRGRLAIMPRPCGGDWLGEELVGWHRAGIEVLVSLLDAAENVELGLADEETLAREAGMEFRAFPITDRGLPDSVEEFLTLVAWLHGELQGGRGIGVHCRAGIGRSSLLAACLLVKSGFSASAAFGAISRARGIEVPDTPAQAAWLGAMQSRLACQAEP